MSWTGHAAAWHAAAWEWEFRLCRILLRSPTGTRRERAAALSIARAAASLTTLQPRPPDAGGGGGFCISDKAPSDPHGPRCNTTEAGAQRHDYRHAGDLRAGHRRPPRHTSGRRKGNDQVNRWPARQHGQREADRTDRAPRAQPQNSVNQIMGRRPS